MKLALVTGDYPPHFEGGTERVVRAQARELAALGHEVRVVSGAGFVHRGADVERAEVDGLPVAFVPRLEHEYVDLHYERPRLVELLLRETAGADWVHVHHWFTLGQDLVRALARRHRVAVTFHDLFATCARFFRVPVVDGVTCPPRGEHAPCLVCLAPDLVGGRPEEELAGGLARRAAAFEAEARAAELLFAPSATHARAVEALLGLEPDRVRVLHHGLCAPIEAPARRDWDGAGPLVVAHPGHRARAKGTGDLVRALAALPPGSVRLLLAGTEVEEGFDAELDRAAGSLELVRTGAFSPEELGELLATAHLVALPSRAQESYGLVLDEALAAGLPVWVSDRGALHERVGAAGRVLPAEDPDAWTRAFREVLDDPGVLARQRAAIPTRLETATEAARCLDALYRRSSSTP